MAIIKSGSCKINFLNPKALGVGDVYGLELPYVLPGEIAEFELHEYRGMQNSVLKSVLETSDKRAEPECIYFGACGGCLLQHMKPGDYAEFKLSLIKDLLQEKFHNIIQDIIIIGSGVRRRAIFEIVKKDGKIFFGFHRFRSNQIININSCPLLLSEISDFVPELKEELLEILPDKFKGQVFVVNALEGVKWYINSEYNNYGDKPISVAINQISVQINHNAFLQASSDADLVLQDLVCDALKKEEGLGVDLFCGRGTFAFAIPLDIEGFDIDSSAISALNEAAKNSSSNLRAFVRNLFEEPVSSKELNKYSFAIINPPRAGAEAQIKQIAKSKIKRVVYVSCNPESFIEDFKILDRAGYRLVKLTPVDQFHWSPHLEVVGVFENK